MLCLQKDIFIIFETPMSKLVEIARFAHLTEAQMLQSLLRSEGIEATIRNEHIGQLYPGLSNFEVSIDVLDQDAPAAFEVMKNAGYEIFDGSEPLEGVEAVSGLAKHIPFLRKLPLENRIWWFLFILAVLIGLLIFLSTYWVDK